MTTPVERAALHLTDRDVLLDQHLVVRGDAVIAELSPQEVALLRYLADRADRTVDRRELLRQVWGYAEQVESRAVDKAVHRLRQKLELDPSEPRHLLGVRALGYRLQLEEDAPLGEDPILEAEALDERVRHGEARAARERLAALEPEVLAQVDRALETDPARAARGLLALCSRLRSDPRAYLERCDRALASDPGPWRHRLRAARAEAAILVGRVEEVVRDSERVLEEAPAEEALARAHAALVLTHADGLGGLGPEPILAHLERSLEALAGRRELRMEARVMIALSRYYVRLGRPEVGLRAARHSAEVLERSGDLELLGVALNYLSNAQGALGLWEDRRATLERSVAVYREARMHASVAVTLAYLGGALLDLGRLAEAQVRLEEGRALASENGNKGALHNIHEALGIVALELGLLLQARHHLSLAERVAEELGNPLFRTTTRALLALAAMLEEDAALSARWLERARASASTIAMPELHRWLLCLEAMQLCLEGAPERLPALAARLRALGPASDASTLHAELMTVAEGMARARAGQGGAPASSDEPSAFVERWARAHGHEAHLLARAVDSLRAPLSAQRPADAAWLGR